MVVNMEGKYTQKPTMNIKRVFCHSLNDLGSFIVVCDWDWWFSNVLVGWADEF